MLSHVFRMTLSVVFFSVLACLTTTLQAADSSRPNIVYILLDDAGYGDLSCYGQKLFKTPNIDQMAAEGLKFTDHYSGSTVCAPTRCCLMTGLHTGHTVVRGNREIQPEGQAPMPADIVTLPRLLRRKKRNITRRRTSGSGECCGWLSSSSQPYCCS